MCRSVSSLGRNRRQCQQKTPRTFDSLLLKELQELLYVSGCKSPGHESWKLHNRYQVWGGNYDAMRICSFRAIYGFLWLLWQGHEPGKYKILIVNMSIGMFIVIELWIDCSCDLCSGGRSCGHLLEALLAPQMVQSCQGCKNQV